MYPPLKFIFFSTSLPLASQYQIQIIIKHSTHITAIFIINRQQIINQNNSNKLIIKNQEKIYHISMISYYLTIIQISINKMYAIIDCLCFVGGIVGFAFALTTSTPLYSLIPVGWIVMYPIVNQTLYNIAATLFGNRIVYQVPSNTRYVYRPSYNFSFCGIQKFHPFDAQKYGNICKRLIDMDVVRKNSFLVPNKIPRSLLLEKVSKFYLFKLCYTLVVCKLIQMPLIFLPQFLLRWRVLDPMLEMTQGTILASCIALKRKWAINLGGGFHHASFLNGGGFCIYPDISLAIHYLRTRMNIKKVMIIDLDAHQGNGHQIDHLNDQNTFIVDAYNHNIYPNDTAAKKAISRDLIVNYQVTDEEYLDSLDVIIKDITVFRPEFIIYNAGTDILQGDPLGGCQLVPSTIIQRDEKIFRMALQRNIPIVMVMSGGYQKINAQVIAESLQNIQKLFGEKN